MSRVQLDPKFNKIMRRLPDDVVAPIKQGINDRGESVLAAARARCPVRTGALRDSIGIKVVLHGLAVLVGFDSKVWPDLWKKAGWRGVFVEFGTKGYNAGDTRQSRGKYTLGGSRHTVGHSVPPRPAQPFLRPAFYDTRDENLEHMRTLIYNVLRNTASGS